MTTKTRSRPKPSRGTKKRRVSPLVAVSAGIFVLALVATILSLGGEDAGPQVAPVTITGEQLTTFDASAPDSAAGRPAPVVAGRDIAGDAMTIAAEGRPMAIAFLAHWCSHCQNEVRVLTDAFEAGAIPDGVELRAVSTLVDKRAPNYPPIAWLEREGWPVRSMLDDASSSAARAFGLKGTPFWVFLHADGTVAGRVSGEIGPERLTQILDSLAAADVAS